MRAGYRPWLLALTVPAPSPLVTSSVLWLSLAATGLIYILSHHTHFSAPSVVDDGWWRWHDQSLYLKAARAWAAGNLDPSQHWYLPGYSLIGAAFIWLTPVQPFYVPDLLCVLASGWLLSELAGRLAPVAAWGRVVGALVFATTLAISPAETRVFVEPWTTTPAVPLIYGSLVLALRFLDDMSLGRAAVLGMVTGCVALFRPTEATVMLAVVASFAGVALLRVQADWRWRCVVGSAGVAGAMLPLLVLGGLHYAVFGLQAGDYLRQSRHAGFEWRLIPLRWVMLFVGPEPLLAGERGMMQVFAWIIPAIAGMAACLVSSRGTARARHMLVIGAVVAHCAVYLAYRDLHTQGLFRFQNQHYFKWVLPVLAMYATYLFAAVPSMKRPGLAWAAGALAVALLCCWRPEWQEPAPGYSRDDARLVGRTLVLASGLHAVRDGVRIAASGSFQSIYLASYEIDVGSALYASNADAKAFPIKGGFLFTMLRPIPAERTVVHFPPGMGLATDEPPRIGREIIVLGWPSWAERMGTRLQRRLFGKSPTMSGGHGQT